MVEIEDFKNKYDLVKSRGEGGFGHVYEIKVKKTGEKRAVKIISKETIINDFIKTHDYKDPTEKQKKELLKDIYKEIEFMKIIEGKNKDNINTVKYYENFENDNQIAIVMEYCNKDLFKYFCEKKDSFSDMEILELLSQLNNTLKIMHDNKICHLDISLDNILIKYENGKIIYKLSDYGVSKKLINLKQKLSTKAGKPVFMAPEISKGEYIEKCDLWSIGVVIYILIRKNNPSNEIIEKISDIDLTNNSNLNNLIKRLLVEDPQKRISWNEYFNHPFFKKNNDNQIIIKLKVSDFDFDKIKNEFKDINILENDNYMENNTIKEYEKKNKELEDLNENNTKLFINNDPFQFKKNIKPSKTGEYEIKLIFTKKIKNLSYLFRGCENIISIDLSSFDTSESTNMNYMFGRCIHLEEINLTNINTSNVIDMSYMFNKCKRLKKIIFPECFSIEKVENMSFMFHLCDDLSTIEFPLSFSKNNLKNICGLFGKCDNLTKIDLRNLKTENVDDMSFMFDQCENLETILINPNKFITKKATKMSYMFNHCYKLKKIDLTSFNPENVIFASFMFNECLLLEEADLSKMKINEKANLVYMFSGCENLKKINLSSFFITNKNEMNNMFDNLKSIQKVIVNKNSINEFKKNFKNIKYIFSKN